MAYKQVPHMLDIGDGEMEQVPWIDDKDWYTFDHIPIWYEPAGNHSWGPKDSGCRNLKTGGKDKDCFTVVLTISKLGKKLIPFIVFKGLSLLWNYRCHTKPHLTNILYLLSRTFIAVPAPAGKKIGNVKSVTAEIKAAPSSKQMLYNRCQDG